MLFKLVAYIPKNQYWLLSGLGYYLHHILPHSKYRISLKLTHAETGVISPKQIGVRRHDFRCVYSSSKWVDALWHPRKGFPFNSLQRPKETRRVSWNPTKTYEIKNLKWQLDAKTKTSKESKWSYGSLIRIVLLWCSKAHVITNTAKTLSALFHMGLSKVIRTSRQNIRKPEHYTTKRRRLYTCAPLPCALHRRLHGGTAPQEPSQRVWRRRAMDMNIVLCTAMTVKWFFYICKWLKQKIQCDVPEGLESLEKMVSISLISFCMLETLSELHEVIRLLHEFISRLQCTRLPMI